MPATIDNAASFLARVRPARIVVFRALVLGDMLCAIPALRALRRAAPTAHIALVGLGSMDGLIARYDGLVDECITFPGHPGFPEEPERPGRWAPFIESLRARRFDLAIQMHGSGENANELVRGFGARHDAGFRMPTAAAAMKASATDACFVQWQEHQSEVLRCLALVGALGAEVDGPDAARLALPCSAAERQEWGAVRTSLGLHCGGFVCVHPGARWSSRRWPLERFAAVALALASEGLRVVLTGAADERPLVASCAALLRANGVAAIDLSGRTNLGVLASLLDDAALLVANDTGISHVAAARGTPSVIVASGSDVARWAPLDRRRHRVLWHDLPCRPCMHRDCPIGHVCARRVSVEAVLEAARTQIAARPEATHRSRPTLAAGAALGAR